MLPPDNLHPVFLQVLSSSGPLQRTVHGSKTDGMSVASISDMDTDFWAIIQGGFDHPCQLFPAYRGFIGRNPSEGTAYAYGIVVAGICDPPSIMGNRIVENLTLG